MTDPGSSALQAAPGLFATPRSWRVAALALLLAGIGLGMGAAGTAADLWIVLGFATVLALGLVPIMVGTRHPPVTPEAVARYSGALPRVLVLVAARNEAAVLPALLGDLAVQDHRDPHGLPQFEIIVVDDQSTDGTGAAVGRTARALGITSITRVLRREGTGLVAAKGAALAWAHPETRGPDVVAVLDADARIGPDYLRRAARYVAAGVPALTARRRTLRPNRSMLATIQADEQAQDGALQRGRWARDGCSEFRGNGLVIRRDILERIGGIPAASLTEDLDLSTRLASMLGVTVAWALDLEVWEEPVVAWRGLWRQRLRWSEGGVRRLFEYGPKVIASRVLARRGQLDFAAYGVQLVVPPIIVGALIGAIVRGAPFLVGGLVGSYLVAGGVLAYDALRWETDERGAPLPRTGRIARAIWVALFSALWLAAVTGALWRLATRRGEVVFDKTTHRGSVRGTRDANPLPARGSGKP